MTRTWKGPARQTGPNENATTKQPLGVEGNPTGRPVPLYGSPEWHALPNSDPRKSAAVWRAAECWRTYWEPDAVAARLADELEFLDHEVIRRIRATSYEVASGADWRSLAQQPTYATLAARRAEVPDKPCGSPRCRGCSRCIRADAVRRQGGDYMGRRRNRGAA